MEGTFCVLSCFVYGRVGPGRQSSFGVLLPRWYVRPTGLARWMDGICTSNTLGVCLEQILAKDLRFCVFVG